MNDFAQISGNLDSKINALKLFIIFKKKGISANIDGEDLNVGGASSLRIEFDKGINTFRSEGGGLGDVLAQAKTIVAVLTENEISYFIEVCDNDWEEITSFGDYGRN